jgi:hypothetical protein
MGSLRLLTFANYATIERMKKLLVMVAMLCACGGDDGGSGGVDASTGNGGCTAIPTDNCSGDDVCPGNGQECGAAFPRMYWVTNIQVTVPTTDPNGAEWDVGGGAPDLFVVVGVNGTEAGRTQPVQDQFSATFSGPVMVQLAAAQATLDLHVYDSDVTSGDDALDCSAPMTAELLRGHQLSCAPPTGAMMTFTITPP